MVAIMILGRYMPAVFVLMFELTSFPWIFQSAKRHNFRLNQFFKPRLIFWNNGSGSCLVWCSTSIIVVKLISCWKKEDHPKMSLAWFLDFLTSAPALIPPLAGLPLVSRRGPPPAAAGAPLSVTWTLNPSTSVRRFRLLLSPDNIRHRSPLHPVAWLRPYLLRLVFLTLSLLV